jgi:hypothetical protein
MDRMKTFGLYALGIIVFFIFSSFLIEVGLNSTYKNIDGKNNVEQIEITNAEATLVNGRISGKLNTEMTKELYSKYIKIDLYSPRDVLLGTKYIEMKDVAINNNSFETYFKLQDVKRYEISLVDEKENTEKEELFGIKLSKTQILIGVIIALIIK